LGSGAIKREVNFLAERLSAERYGVKWNRCLGCVLDLAIMPLWTLKSHP